MTKYSICVPRVDLSINKYTIFESFRKLFIGRILRIDLIKHKSGKFNRAFIHYKYTYKTPASKEIIDILDDGQYINLVYDFPRYWRCYKSNT